MVWDLIGCKIYTPKSKLKIQKYSQNFTKTFNYGENNEHDRSDFLSQELEEFNNKKIKFQERMLAQKIITQGIVFNF